METPDLPDFPVATSRRSHVTLRQRHPGFDIDLKSGNPALADASSPSHSTHRVPFPPHHPLPTFPPHPPNIPLPPCVTKAIAFNPISSPLHPRFSLGVEPVPSHPSGEVEAHLNSDTSCACVRVGACVRVRHAPYPDPDK